MVRKNKRRRQVMIETFIGNQWSLIMISRKLETEEVLKRRAVATADEKV